MSKQARWERFHNLTASRFRDRLGYGADAKRIDPLILHFRGDSDLVEVTLPSGTSAEQAETFRAAWGRWAA